MLFATLRRVADSRPPDFSVSPGDDPALLRWYIIPRNHYLNIYLHKFLRSDDDGALHDHPWMNLSILLDGQYVEHTIDAGGVHRRVARRAGDWKFRMPSHAHRIEVDKPVWTLFVTGPTVRLWGFHCPSGWVPFGDFIHRNNRRCE